MNPDYGEDSAEVIGSSVEEEGEAEDEGEAEVPEDGAGGQPQLDRASSNEPRREKTTAAGGGQTEIAQPTAPAPDAAVTSDPPTQMPPPRLLFSPLLVCLSNLLKTLLDSNNSTRGVYLELLFEDSAKGLCKY